MLFHNNICSNTVCEDDCNSFECLWDNYACEGIEPKVMVTIIIDSMVGPVSLLIGTK